MNGSTPVRPIRTRFKLLLIMIVALLTLPTFSISQGKEKNDDISKQLVKALQERIGDFSVEVRGIEGNLKEQAGSIPREIQDSQFSSTIANIGNIIYDAQTQHSTARKNLKSGVIQDIQNIGIDTTNPNALRGNGGCTDKEIEEWLWEEPADFGKDLEDFGRKIRFLIRAFDVTENEEVRIRPNLSVQVFPHIEDARLFTAGMYSPVPYHAMTTRIGGIVGGSYGDVNTGQTVACAGVFGWAAPGTNVNVIALGFNGPFNGSDTADANGRWDVQLEGLSHGYYEFTADDGDTEDIREQAFVQFKFNF